MANPQTKIPALQYKILCAFAPTQQAQWINDFYFRIVQQPIGKNIESDFPALDSSNLAKIDKILPQLQQCQKFIQQNQKQRNEDLELTSTFASLEKLNLPKKLKFKLKQPFMCRQMTVLYQQSLTVAILHYMKAQVTILEKDQELSIYAQAYKQWIEQALKHSANLYQSYWQKMLIQPVKNEWEKLKITLSGKVTFQLTILARLLKAPSLPENININKISENTIQLLLCLVMFLLYNTYWLTHIFYFATTLPLRLIFGATEQQMAKTIKFVTISSLLPLLAYTFTPLIVGPALLGSGIYLMGNMAVLGALFTANKDPIYRSKVFFQFIEFLNMFYTCSTPCYKLETFHEMSQAISRLRYQKTELSQREKSILNRYKAGEVDATLNDRKQLFVEKVQSLRDMDEFVYTYLQRNNKHNDSSLDIAKKLKLELEHDALMFKIESAIEAVRPRSSRPASPISQNNSAHDLIRRIILLKNNPDSFWHNAIAKTLSEQQVKKLLTDIKQIGCPRTFVNSTQPSKFTEEISILSKMPKPKRHVSS